MQTPNPEAARVAELESALRGCIPWIASNGRGAAQEALAVACELVGYDAYDWTAHPDVLAARRELLGLPDRRGKSPIPIRDRRGRQERSQK